MSCITLSFKVACPLQKGNCESNVTQIGFTTSDEIPIGGHSSRSTSCMGKGGDFYHNALNTKADNISLGHQDY